MLVRLPLLLGCMSRFFMIVFLWRLRLRLNLILVVLGFIFLGLFHCTECVIGWWVLPRLISLIHSFCPLRLQLQICIFLFLQLCIAQSLLAWFVYWFRVIMIFVVRVAVVIIVTFLGLNHLSLLIILETLDERAFWIIIRQLITLPRWWLSFATVFVTFRSEFLCNLLILPVYLSSRLAKVKTIPADALQFTLSVKSSNHLTYAIVFCVVYTFVSDGSRLSDLSLILLPSWIASILYALGLYRYSSLV